MRNIIFLLLGVLFAIVLTKSEAVSWFRMQEMFRFQSFHMYGIIGTAVACGAIIIQLIKRFKLKNADGEVIVIPDKPKTYKASLGGGIFFGLGWAMTGACPGPLYTLLGQGIMVIGVVIIAALFGTYTYAMLKHKLPH